MGDRGIVLAWLAGLGLMTYRDARKYSRPVPPGRYGAASGFFVLLALAASYPPAATAATVTAWGFDLAIFLQPGILPGGSTGAGGGGRGGKGK